VIMGGSEGEDARAEILRFDPSSGRVQQVGRLPRPVTHAMAVALGGFVYLLGGRSSTQGEQTSAILSIAPLSGKAALVGRLPDPRSDAAAVVLGSRIVLAGGLSARGTQSSILELRPRQATR
jgi:N-acetylneuraminic acid mutarotase